jgi:glycosyltransferase involved in cell wall biosynthesis
MKAAVIIGTYNNETHIAQAIESVRSQTLSDWRCIIIDNGSSDASGSIAQNEIRMDGRFEYIQKQNEGPSAFRNMGFSRVKGECEYVHFLDGDDVLKKDFLEILCYHLDTNPNAGIAACQFNVINEGGELISSGLRSRYAPGFLGFPKRLMPKNIITPFEAFYAATGQGPFAVFRASVFARTTGYEMSFWSHEDSDIFCQMALLSEVHYLPDRLYSKRKHEHNLTGSSLANYGRFREKWDFYFSDDPETTRRVDSAFKYYHGRHAPLRHFKIAIMAFRQFLKSGKVHSFRWSLQCFKKGVDDLFLKKELKRRWTQRERLRRSRKPLDVSKKN